MQDMRKLDKEAFKERVKDNVRTLYRKTLKEADKQQIFQAVAYACKDIIIDEWMASQQQFDQRLNDRILQQAAEHRQRQESVRDLSDSVCHFINLALTNTAALI